MPFNAILYLKTISNIIELYKINILSKIMPLSNYLFVVIINFVRPHTNNLVTNFYTPLMQVLDYVGKIAVTNERARKVLIRVC